MPVVFRFESLDARQRGTLVLPDIEAAVEHINTTFELADFRFDEEGEEPVNVNSIKELLCRREHVRLYDQQAWHSQHTVEICCADG